MDMEHEIKKAAPSAQQAAGSIDTGELRRLAEAAKDSGDWLSVDRTVYALEHHGWRKGEELFRNRFSFNVQRGPEFDDKDCAMVAEFCAAANPAAILRLLDALAATPAQPIAPQTEVPQGFIDYVQANYNGVIDIHRPEWHAKRLWNAAMHQIKVAQPIAVSAPTDERAAFEVWAKVEFVEEYEDLGENMFARIASGQYESMLTRNAWKAFEAGTVAKLGIKYSEQDRNNITDGYALAARAAAPVSGQGASELPPLPEKDYFGERRNGDDIEGHTDEAMTTYGQLCIDSRPRSEDSRAKVPTAYAIYGINGGGKHFLRDVKVIQPTDKDEGWRSDDDGLGDSWSGNEALYSQQALASTTPQKADNE